MKVQQSNGSRIQRDIAIMVSDKIAFKLKLIKRDKEGQFILINVKSMKILP